MAKGFEVSEWIDRPPDEVWAILADPSKGPQWMKDVDEIRPLDDAPVGGGKRYEVSLSTRGRSRNSQMRISAWAPPLSLTLSTRHGGVEVAYTYCCKAARNGTKVILDAVCLANGLVARLFSGFIARAMENHDGGQLEALKALLENGDQKPGE